MKQIIRYTLLLLALCFAFGQANVIRTQSESVSLRFEEAFALDEAGDFAAVWMEETASICGINATLIRFAGDAQLVFPTEWVFGTPPCELKESTCAVSTAFALECFGGQNVVGLKLGEDTICGVFRHGEAVVLKPDREGFTAAELFPIPEKTDLYRWGLDRAAQAGLPEPTEVLCGPEGAFLARLLPWGCFLWLLLRLTGRKGWVIVGIPLLVLLPDWFFPTRLSDIVFWSELFDSTAGRIRDWFSLLPSLRDTALKWAWLHLMAAMLWIRCCFLKDPSGSQKCYSSTTFIRYSCKNISTHARTNEKKTMLYGSAGPLCAQAEAAHAEYT